MKINKYFTFAFIYFFLNSLALPIGLTYTACLTPLLYGWVSATRMKEVLLPWFVCLIPFVIVHFLNMVDEKSYILSILNYTAVYIFCQAFYTFLKSAADKEKIFRQLLLLNFIACLLAIPVYYSVYHDVLWMPHTELNGVTNVSRLKLFTYESSYYASLFTPFFFFYLLQLVLTKNKINSWLLLVMLLLPFALSFSIGVIGCILLSVMVTCLLNLKKLIVKKRVLRLLLLSGLTTCFVVSFLLVFYPHNGIFLRISDILSGKDTSGNGRTFEAFMLAEKILEQKSAAWGVGAGQIKVLGGDIIRSYYLYGLDYNTIAIPNAAAETLAIFGWIGIGLRIGIELFLFFYTRVWTNYYSLLLFVFIFLYQFTGSFITNIAEYVIWILAFTRAFPAFDVQQKQEINLFQPSLA